MRFQSYEQFNKDQRALKQSTITADQLLSAVVRHMVRMDRKFTLYVNGRLPKPMNELLEDVFDMCHLQQPFYTQHCANRGYRYMNMSKNRVKIDFTMKYRMPRDAEKWMITEMQRILSLITNQSMTPLEKVFNVHDYIVRNYNYELHTEGSPFAVYTFMQEKKGVCMAYALLFEKMMELLGIPCYYVVGHAAGEGDNGHAWNMVKLDGHWYHIDGTWNDLGSRTKTHEIRYRYFLRDDEFMKKDHRWNYAHYPICHSKKYAQLTNLYDAAILRDTLYFPHPKTAVLTKCVLTDEKLVFHEVAPIRIQYCAAINNTLYFSHFMDSGALYAYDGTLTKLDPRTVRAIHTQLDTIRVHFNDDECLLIERICERTVTRDVQASAAIVEKVTLLSFDNSWFSQYTNQLEGSFPLFEAVDTVTLQLFEEISQLTVDIRYDKTLEIQLTANRKPVQLQRKAKLVIPKSALTIPTFKHARLTNGQEPEISYLETDTAVTFSLKEGMTLYFQ